MLRTLFPEEQFQLGFVPIAARGFTARQRTCRKPLRASTCLKSYYNSKRVRGLRNHEAIFRVDNGFCFDVRNNFFVDQFSIQANVSEFVRCLKRRLPEWIQFRLPLITCEPPKADCWRQSSVTSLKTKRREIDCHRGVEEIHAKNYYDP